MGRLVIYLDRNFDPTRMAHYLDPKPFVKERKRRKEGVALYLDIRFGPAKVAQDSAPGHQRTLVHY